jgi:hypothetical protein
MPYRTVEITQGPIVGEAIQATVVGYYELVFGVDLDNRLPTMSQTEIGDRDDHAAHFFSLEIPATAEIKVRRAHLNRI